MPDLVHYAIPAFVILLITEAVLSSVRQAERYESRDTFASLAMGIGNVLITLPMKAAAFVFYLWLWDHRVFSDLSEHAWVWLLLIPAEDFCYYWFHRGHHRIRVLWAAHVNHHSSQKYNLATALRQSWTTPLTGILFWAPLALLGFHPVLIFMAQSISLIYQFWIHTEFIDRMGPLEWVLNTPSHHRVHHGSDLEYLDKNHGGIFIIWDRLFGTFKAEKDRPTYGLLTNIDTYNPVKIAFHEWTDMAHDLGKSGSWWDKLRYVLGPPGWSHDGSKKTVDQLRLEATANLAREAVTPEQPDLEQGENGRGAAQTAARE